MKQREMRRIYGGGLDNRDDRDGDTGNEPRVDARWVMGVVFAGANTTAANV